jgi:hypothetical protein
MSEYDENTKGELVDEEAPPKSFARFLSILQSGDVEYDASCKLRDLVADLKAFADDFNQTGKGELTLKLKISVDPSELVQVNHEIIVKKPKRKSKLSNLWLDADGNVVPTDPRQQTLPGIRAVAGGRSAERVASAKSV